MTNSKNNQIIDEFNRCGFILPEDTLLPNVVDDFKNKMHEIISKRKLNKKSKSRFNGHLHLPLTVEDNMFLRLSKDPTILKYVSLILGSDIILFHSHAYIKDIESESEVRWHQDGYYFPLYPKNAVTVWIKLDDSDPSISCLEYLSEKTQRLYHHTSDKNLISFKYFINEDSIDRSKSILAPRKKGQFIIHDIMTLHRSGTIVDDTVRSAIMFRYIPSSVFYDHEEHKTRIVEEFKINNIDLSLEEIDSIKTGCVQVQGKNLNKNNKIIADIS